VGVPILVKILLDTHVWLWSLLEPTRLPKRVAAKLGDPGNQLWLSPISVWEAVILAEKRRIRVVGDPAEWVERACTAGPFHEAALTREIALESRRLSPSLQDPADRFIAATARVLDLTLATADARLLDLKGLGLLSAA